MAIHTDIPTSSEIERLVARTAGPCVSIYFPTHRTTQDTARDRLVLRDLTGRALEQLRAVGTPADDVATVEEDLLFLVEEDDDFWVEQADSLAIFAAPGRFETHRLPNHLTEVVEVSDRFHIKPLLRAVTFPQAAWVLALSQGSVRLLEVGPSGPPTEVDVADLPRDAWQSSGNKVHRAREAAYARKVDAALRGVLGGSSLPLILAASQPMAALFASVNTYPHMVADRVHGSPDDTSDAELAQAIRTILDGVYADLLDEVANRFGDLAPTGRTATDLSDLARLATFGAIETLIVDIDAVVPGEVDDAGAVRFEADADAGSYGVTDEIVRRVLAARGRVLAVRAGQVPHGGPAAAILRYVV